MRAHQTAIRYRPTTPLRQRGQKPTMAVTRRGEWNMKIEIYDQLYNVNADGNEDYLRELAAYVDGKMRSVADATHMVDSLKVAVLAALNIADETFAMRKRQTEIEGPLRKRVEKCVSMVEKALEQTN